MGNADSAIPRLGLGTWQNTAFEQCRESVRTALEIGYRHVDTAELYENEPAVGAGVAAADVDRDDVYLATKILHPRNVDGDLTRGEIRAAVADCLSRLDVDAVDLMYVHWPSDYDLQLVHATLAELRDEGRIDDVGVSNYEPEHIETALETDPDIVANQVELHPLLPQASLREYCTETGIDVVAYAPLAHGNVFDIPEFQEIADALGASVAQVSLAWHRANGIAAVPKATSEAHIRDNWNSRDLDVSEDDIATIEGIDRRERFFDSDYAPDW
jgi:diketogulonate reductase-like aldo/keto reductase